MIGTLRRSLGYTKFRYSAGCETINFDSDDNLFYSFIKNVVTYRTFTYMKYTYIYNIYIYTHICHRTGLKAKPTFSALSENGMVLHVSQLK